VTPFEQSVWIAVYAAEVSKRNLGVDGCYPVDPAVKAADHAVADLARYRRANGQEDAQMNGATDARKGKRQ
jgi:hypothetical protein